MVYSAPYSRWKDHSNFIFEGGISGEGEEQRYSEFRVYLFRWGGASEAAQTRSKDTFIQQTPIFVSMSFFLQALK